MDRCDRGQWHSAARFVLCSSLFAALGCGPTPASNTGATVDTATTTGASSTTAVTTDPLCVEHSDCEDAAQPVCVGGICVPCGEASDPDLACGERSAELPACSTDGSCVVCNDTTSEACPSETPACEDFVCRGCLEHSECPDSACHISGDTPGRCFDESQVVDVSTQQQIDAALAQLEAGDDLVLRTALETGFEVALDVDAELAVIEQSNLPVDQRPQLSASQARGILYTSRANADIWCGYFSDLIGDSPETELWVDGSLLQHTLGVGCESHVRRSTMQSLFQVAFSSLFVESSVLKDPHARIVDAVVDGWATVDIVASTIIGPFTCIGPVDVEVRNSILLANPNVDAMQCSAGVVSYSATSDDSPGEGNVEVGGLIPSWFLGTAVGDYHLADGHPFDDVARWIEGDPRTDIDGEPRLSVPGGMDVAGADVP